MANTSTRILSIYKSRLTIIELLDHQEYDTTEYEGFSINEIDAMYSNSQLDMLLTHKKDGKKIYIKYYLASKQIRPANLDEIIEDLFVIENVLTKDDTLVIITEDEPNDTIVSKVRYEYDHNGTFIVIHNIRRLQFNVLNHKLVPECVILEKSEVDDLKKKYNISNLSQLPEMSRFDPVALAICLRPGQVCKFQRESATAMEYIYYRVCV
jgi:DNA-directed RNA polymerase subunit H (RpoH/RPB5)